MFPYLNLFGAAIAVSPLLILVGLWFGSWLAEKRAAEHGIRAELIYNLMMIGLAAFVIGGRLSYAAQHLNAFTADPLSLISRNFGLFDPFGGAVAAALAVLIYGQGKEIRFWAALDAFTPLFAVLMAVIPAANLATGDAFGAPSSLPWAIELWGEYRHPVQIYEAIAAGGILYLVWSGRMWKTGEPGGFLFLRFTAASALARLIFEGLRGSSPIGLFNIRLYQLAAWAVLAASLVLLDRMRASVNTTE
ncbi:MAG: prolipoprotein diacylglyceryl transferase [Anaerolineales bacterium]|nr:prolipoprotein diacylglyceryl transferase [Anaerolineales bacterium]